MTRKGKDGMFSMWPNWVIDVTFGHEPPCFCPIEDDGTIMLGMNLVTTDCPGNLVGVIHSDGQEAAENWANENKEFLDGMMNKARP